MRWAEFSEILRRELGELGELGERVLSSVRRECPGESIHVPQRPARPEILPEDTPQTVQARYGVPRRTAYRWVTRWRRG
jgi:hypothetical protein